MYVFEAQSCFFLVFHLFCNMTEKLESIMYV